MYHLGDVKSVTTAGVTPSFSCTTPTTRCPRTSEAEAIENRPRDWALGCVGELVEWCARTETREGAVEN
jgi:hypothetical protein